MMTASFDKRGVLLHKVVSLSQQLLVPLSPCWCLCPPSCATAFELVVLQLGTMATLQVMRWRCGASLHPAT